MLAIADCANDDGYAYPSMATIAKKCRMSVRTVIRTVQELECNEWLKVNRKSIDSRWNSYQIASDKLSRDKLARVNDDQEQVTNGEREREKKESNKERKEREKTEPSIEPSIVVEDAVFTLTGEQNGFSLPEWIPRKQWDEYMLIRKQRKYPLTNHAKRCLVGKLDDLRKINIDISVALDEATVSAWKSVYAPKRNGNGKTSVVDWEASWAYAAKMEHMSIEDWKRKEGIE